MKAEIQTQRELMCKALDLINQMQTFEALFSTVDNEYLKGVLKPLQLQYAQTMTELFREIASAGVEKTESITVIVHDSIPY